ncbi:uncharacterized protein LOC108958749 [Eucalyptus grandis]|uniref:uncharacterized protein LOC108958749 n=1 Tax=Eucalyptus grandis TaxID=71139 RepID=UPI0008A0C7A4|nr:uncharacterized protein LOC108958749 [Eucalyptus grandis]
MSCPVSAVHCLRHCCCFSFRFRCEWVSPGSNQCQRISERTLFSRPIDMVTPPIGFNMPVEVKVNLLDIVDGSNDAMYRRHTTTISVDEGVGHLVPHRFKAWYVWFDVDNFGLL